MQFPLTLRFKIVALAPQLTASNADGSPVCYVRQKLMKLKEAVEVFRDDSKAEKLCEIRADRIIDFSATYTFYQGDSAFGAVRRKGMRSLWKAHYEILDHGELEYEIREENGWIKVLDGLLGEIPIIGMLTGYFLHPSYLVSRVSDGEAVVRITKQPAFFEGIFQIESLAALDDGDQLRILLSTLMMTLLERRRG